MKAGIRRIRSTVSPVHNATRCLEYLRIALGRAKAAGSCYTAARIRSAISSAKGAVRAAQYREQRRAGT